MNKLFLIFFAIFIVACQDSVNKNQEPAEGGHGRMQKHRNRFRGGHGPVEPVNIYFSGDTVFVPAGAVVNSKIKLHTVNLQDYKARLNTTGVVKPISGHLAEIATPFDGRVVKSFVRLGQKVNSGAPLFEVSSSEYLETVKGFFQARREKEMAEKNYLRKKDLLETGVGSRKEFDEAKLELDLAEKECEKTLAILNIYNLKPEEADLLQPLIVRSPISGEIVRNDITVGQYIRTDSDPIITVADLDRIWVIARVKEKDLGAISARDQVEICTECLPESPVKGKVDYIGNIMNEQTRSVDVYIECENKNQALKSGMFVTVRFFHKIENAMIIPASSVLQDYDKSILYIKAGPDIYLKKRVEVTSIADSKLIVLSGIEPDNIIVSDGGIYLR